MATNVLDTFAIRVSTAPSFQVCKQSCKWAPEGPKQRSVGLAKRNHKPFERDKLRASTSRINPVPRKEASLLRFSCLSDDSSKLRPSLGAFLRRQKCTKSGSCPKKHCPTVQIESSRGKVQAAATEKARPGRPAYPKTQTGVTLKWVGPSRKEKCSTETVLSSICVDKKVEEQKVECKIETVAWRKRHISASIEVAASLEQVWKVLTDYEQLADFIPNLARSERIPCPNPGRIWLLQLGVQSSMYWQIEARVVLDLEERSEAPEGPELHFSMVEGDFKLFAGKWCLRKSDRAGHVTLHYEVNVLPRAILPTAFVEKIIQADLPRNLRAIADRAQMLITSSSEQGVTSSTIEDPSTALPPSLVTVATGAGAGLDLETNWFLGPGQPPNPASINPQISATPELKNKNSEQKKATLDAPVSDVTKSSESSSNQILQAKASSINGSSREEISPRKRNRADSGKVAEPDEIVEVPISRTHIQRGPLSNGSHLETRQAQSRLKQEPSPRGASSASSENGSRKSTSNELSVERGPQKGFEEPGFALTDAPYFPAECPVIPPENKAVRAQLRHRIDEVHLRRMDDLLENGGVHRRVVAAITIAAPPESIWAVLTDYEALKEFIPNLAKSEVQSRCPEQKRVRLHQVGVKCLCYMVLHAQATMDIVENPYKEIAFKRVDGDFEAFEGRWILEPLGPVHTMVKYVVETRVRKNSLLPEALVEEVIYEDLPANLCAIRKRVESTKSIYSDPSFLSRGEDLPGSSGSLGGGRSWGNSNPRLNLDVAQVSETAHRRKTLRKLPVHKTGTYLDGTKAIDQLTAKKEKSKPLQTPKPRTASPSTYSDFSALENALRAFISDRGLCGHMPTRAQLRGAGRVDLEKGMRLHGGPSNVASRMGLKVQKQQKPARYWCDIGNMEREIRAFQSATGLDLQVMPTRRLLEKAGRFDIARALEKWGGAKALATTLQLTIVERKRVA